MLDEIVTLTPQAIIDFSSGAIEVYGNKTEVRRTKTYLNKFKRWLQANGLEAPVIRQIHFINKLPYDINCMVERMANDQVSIQESIGCSIFCAQMMIENYRAWMTGADGTNYIFFNKRGKIEAFVMRSEQLVILHELIHCALKIDGNYKRLRQNYKDNPAIKSGIMGNVDVSDYPARRRAEEIITIHETSKLMSI